MKNIDIVFLFTIAAFVGYYMCKKERFGSIEGFAAIDDARQAVREVYNADIDAIRNLSAVATKLQAGGITIPGDTTVTTRASFGGGMSEGIVNIRNRDGRYTHFNWPDGQNYIRGNVIVDGVTTVNGNVNTTGKILEGNNALVPRGTIVMWNGASAPAGWALCNGGNGTPDLRDRFIVGTGSSYSVGATGGANTVTLTVAQMPKHQHDYIIASNFWGGGNAPGRGATAGNGWNSKFTKTDRGPYDGSEADRDYPPSGRDGGVGGNQPHENRPPYYALAYIMKL